MLNWIINVKLQYSKPFNCVQTNKLWLLWNVTYQLFIYKSLQRGKISQQMNNVEENY